MNPIHVGLGVLAISYGLCTLVLRFTNPSAFQKLQAMKEQWGDGAGNAIHLIAYTIVPIGVGIVFLVLGITGKSPFGG